MTKERNYNIDILRIIACFGVVVLHTIGYKNNILLPIYYLGTISIPIFFMISGYLINLKKDLTKKYILRKIINSIIFVLIWVVISTIILVFKDKALSFFKIFVGTFTQKEVMAILWFMWAIIIMYLLSPILRYIIRNEKSKRKFLIFMILLSEIIYVINITILNKNNLLISEIKIDRKLNLKNLIILCIGMIIYEVLVGRFLLNDLRAENFYDSLIVKLAVIYIFVYILNMKKEMNYKYVLKCSKYTLGIYAMHYIIIKVLREIVDLNNSLYSIICVFIVFGLCYLCCYIIEKIPILNKIINNNYIKTNIG